MRVNVAERRPDAVVDARVSASPFQGRSGFTLIEMLMVVAIITILMGMSFVMFSTSVDFTDRLKARVAGAAAKSRSAVASRVNKTGPVLLTDRHIVVFNDSVTDVQAVLNLLASAYKLQGGRVYSLVL